MCPEGLRSTPTTVTGYYVGALGKFRKVFKKKRLKMAAGEWLTLTQETFRPSWDRVVRMVWEAEVLGWYEKCIRIGGTYVKKS